MGDHHGRRPLVPERLDTARVGRAHFVALPEGSVHETPEHDRVYATGTYFTPDAPDRYRADLARVCDRLETAGMLRWLDAGVPFIADPWRQPELVARFDRFRADGYANGWLT